MILKSGANVVLTTKGIDDLCMKYFVEAGAMAVRRVKKEDLRRIAKATGGSQNRVVYLNHGLGNVIVSLANLEGEETFDASSLGSADEVVQERIADDELILIRVTHFQFCHSKQQGMQNIEDIFDYSSRCK